MLIEQIAMHCSTGAAYYSMLLWQIMCYKLWLRSFYYSEKRGSINGFVNLTKYMIDQ